MAEGMKSALELALERTDHVRKAIHEEGLTLTEAQREQLAAERERSRLVQLRRDRGAASDLEWLDAQRSLFATEQATIQARLAELQNRLALYRALGGEQAPLPSP